VTPEKWQRLKGLFEEATSQAPPQRAVFIENVRLENEEIGSELARLFEAAEQAGALDRPVADFHQILHLTAIHDGISPDDQTTRAGHHPPNQVFAERYKLIRQIGKGGMGEVYEAEDLRLRQRVALKTILPEIAGDPVAIARFKSEIVLAQKVTHPNVCRIHGLGLHKQSDGRELPFLTMEFLPGETLSARLKRGAMDLAEALPIVHGMIDGLSAAHRAGVIHRDFKSSNVMLVPDEGGIRAVITDFGLAKPSQPANDGTELTRRGAITGTLRYMSPEQINGETLTPASDIYSLGIVVYEIVTGRVPFTGDSEWAIISAHLNTPPPSPRKSVPNLDAKWEAAILKCLRKRPDERFSSAQEFKAALLPDAPPISVPAASRASRGRMIPAIAATAVLASVAVGGLLWYRAHSWIRPSPDAQRWYEQGIAALHAGTYFKATRALERATQLDRNYTLAWARLAEAWAELDFTGKAKDDILLASSLETRRGAPPIDHTYLDAIRSTLTYDYGTAVSDYHAIVGQLPERERAFGYVDLGRAEEKAGNLAEAIKDYEQASHLAPEDPASFVHLGIIESRKGNTADGEAAFGKAEKLYDALGDVEGTAEIAYQRGYVASLLGDMSSARDQLTKSIALARAIPSPQLEIRSVARMSAVEYLAGNIDNSIALANQTIQLSRDNGLDYWAADALARMGNAYLARGDYAKAEQPLQESLRIATETRRPRIVALAQISLASSRNLQDKPDESITYAQKALDYYKPAGFLSESANALTLLARSERDLADFKKALTHALEEIEIVRKANNPASLPQAEESAGSILLEMEQYPGALSHFQEALAAARAVNQLVEYQLIHCADVLWRLGQYEEAQSTIASIPPDTAVHPRIRNSINLISAAVLLSQKRYSDAISQARLGLAGRKDLAPATIASYDLIAGNAAARSRSPRTAMPFCQDARDRAVEAKASTETAEGGLCLAEALIGQGMAQDALPLAESSLKVFRNSGQHESEWRSLLTIARAYSAEHDWANARRNASQALQVLAQDVAGWGGSFEGYAKRPDINTERDELSMLSRIDESRRGKQ
jgi:tetratricopeptide (TPR) repeat protein